MAEVQSKKRKQDESSKTVTKKRKVETINGYCVLPLQMLNSPFLKYVYYKEHKDREQSKEEEGKTLFVTNLTADCTQEDIRSIFSTFGPIASVHMDAFKKSTDKKQKQKKVQMGIPNPTQLLILEEKRRKEEALKREEEKKRPFSAAGYAHIVFESNDTLKKVLKEPSSFDFRGKLERGSTMGVEKWRKAYQLDHIVDINNLQKEVDQFMWKFDKEKLEFKKKIEALSNAPDDDGWVTVTKKGKKHTVGAEGKTVGVADKLDLATLNRIKEKEQKRQKDNFYRFQRTEKRQHHIEELRKRFEEDKKRIEKMRQGRKFRPF